MKSAKRAVVVMAVVIVLAAGIVAGSTATHRASPYHRTGITTEVLVVAEAPRLVTDTVVVQAVRNVAALPAPTNLN